MHRPRRWRDLFLEGVVVVLSILIAFGLDAWWASRREREDLRLELVNVLEEVRDTRNAVDDRIAQLERVMDGSAALVEAMEESPNEPLVLVADTIAYLANRLPTLNPTLSALEALIAAGRLSAVEDRDLRSALGRLPGQMEDAVNAIERQRTVFFSVHTKELGQDFDMAPITRLVEAAADIEEGQRLPSQGDVRYPNRLAVRNNTRSRLVGVQATRRAFQVLASELQALEALISQELER